MYVLTQTLVFIAADWSGRDNWRVGCGVDEANH